jgi:hypothetical protein
MSLLNIYLSITANWRKVFCKTTAFTTCLMHAFCGLTISHRKTITNIIRLLNVETKDFSKHYKLYSRIEVNHREEKHFLG